jgi:23S rRNA pseudouridine1911/1915/1917 synthase
MISTIELTATVSAEHAGRRLDQVAARLFPDYSRARLQRWIRDGQLTLDGRAVAPRETLAGGEILRLVAQAGDAGEWVATAMPLGIVFEDEAILVLDKPPGLVVHPAAGHADDTLLNGLLAHCPALARVPRAGIVHRLDRDTSGLLVVAKTVEAQTRLMAAMQAREVSREYRALVNGLVVSGGTVDRPVGRHPRDRQRMAVREAGGKEAITHYRVLERYRAHTLLAVTLQTGRTHQIRVHLASIGHPVTGDPTYGGRVRLPRGCGAELTAHLRAFRRQALHAYRLSFAHPQSGDRVEFCAPLPEDLQALLAALDADRREEGHGD